MTDPRASVRQWLAARHAEAFNKCWHSHSCGEPCSACLVDAILTAPGVEVREEVPGFDVEPGHRVPMYRVVTIRLPVQPIEAP